MYAVILLKGQNRFSRERWESVPALVQYEGHGFSLRAGPRPPQANGRDGDPVAIYAPDALTEGEFREIYEDNRHRISEFRRKY